MARRSFNITAIWDPNARVWYAESDIEGLHVEGETLEEFEAAAKEFAAELIVENHYRDVEISQERLADLIPHIFFSHRSGTTGAA